VDVAALATWIAAAAAGLYLLMIWLIEYDKQFQSVAATRLPPVVLTCHVLCAGGGLIVWAAYLLYGTEGLGWSALGALVLAAALGTTMAIRWVSVYRAARRHRQAEARDLIAPQLALTPAEQGSARQAAGNGATTAGAGPTASISMAPVLGPPERAFPLSVVITHGLFAGTTLVLVLLTVLDVGR
jgi:hypothetical protein